MVNWNVEIEGVSVTDIFEIDYSEGETDKLGKATIECADNVNNRGFQSGDSVLIKKNGTRDFTGYVTGKPTSAGSDPGLTIECKDKRLELKYEQVNRVFYQMDSGEIIRDALNTTTESKNRRFVHKGEDLEDWSSDAHHFELGSIASQSLYESGSDFIFIGWQEGAGSEKEVYSATFTGVPSSAIPGDGTIDRLITRMLVNNSGQHFSAEVNLRDNYGNDYIWPLNLRGSDFQKFELNAEEAESEASIGEKLTIDGALEYRFAIDGELPEPRAAAIDFARTIPFARRQRNTTLSPTGVEDTGRTITRRVDRSIFELIKELATEDGFISYIDTEDNLYYEQSGQSNSSLPIDYDQTPVLDAEFNRDYENITNKVMVQGSGSIRVTLEDSASIDFYGVSAREEPIVDEAIQSREEAVQRGRGYLKKNAWDDSAFEFEIGDVRYQSLSIGQDIQVRWPPEDINGTYTITDTETDKNGIVSVSLTDADAI